MDSRTSLRKILLIDDDSDYRRLLLSWLGKSFSNTGIVEYDPVARGLPGSEFSWPDYDVLLLDYDLRLNNVNGLDILKANENNKNFPATIMLTGAGSEEVAVRALKSGVSDYLRKDGLQKDQLIAAVDTAFKKHAASLERHYTLEEARKAAQDQADKLFINYKARYDEIYRREIERLKSEGEQYEQELQTHLEKLALFERQWQEASASMQRLQEEITGLREKQLQDLDNKTVQTKLKAVREELDETGENLKVIEQSQSDIRNAMEKVQWKQEQGNTMFQQLEGDLVSFEEGLQQEMKQMSGIRSQVELKKRLLDSARENRKVIEKKHDRKLRDEVSGQLKDMDDKDY